jgi:hypothetical protein
MKPVLLTLLLLLSFCAWCQQADSLAADTLTLEEELGQDQAGEETADTTISYGEQIEHTTSTSPKDVPGSKAYRSEPLNEKKFDHEKWKTIKGTTDYNEKPEKEKKKEAKNDLPTVSIPWASAWLQFIAYAVIIAIVVVLLWIIVKNTSASIRLKRTVTESDVTAAPIENIEELDLAALIRQARERGNFRDAIRLYYLALLKNLHAAHLIAWKKDKTNREYLAELFTANRYFDEMRRLTLLYEQVWYGERALDTASFEQLTLQFERFYNTLNTDSTS